MGKVLYLGLEPLEGAVHYPVIRTERLEVNLERWVEFTHVIFTSRRAVRYLWETGISFGQKVAIAIGEATAGELRERGITPLIAPQPTQEGVIALLETLDLLETFVFLPRSKRARDVLPEYLRQKGIWFIALDLYDTVLQRVEPVPNLEEFEEIVFTSPSTVEGFLQIFGSFPKYCRLRAIGPITKAAMGRFENGR